MIIDIHTHIYTEEAYRTYFNKAKGRVSKALVMASYEHNLEDLLRFTSAKSNLFLAGVVDIESDINEQLEKLEKLLQEKKILGIKLYPSYQYFYPSDEKIYPIAEVCQKYDKPLIFHSGTTYSISGKAMFKYAHPIYIDELAVKFPKCKIIISHFGFPYHLETATVIYKNENVFTEISGTIEKHPPEDARNILNQYVKDLFRVFSYYPEVKKKVMFGTDYSGEDMSLCEVTPYIKLAERVFCKDEQKNVFYNLAENLFFKE